MTVPDEVKASPSVMTVLFFPSSGYRLMPEDTVRIAGITGTPARFYGHMTMIFWGVVCAGMLSVAVV